MAKAMPAEQLADWVRNHEEHRQELHPPG